MKKKLENVWSVQKKYLTLHCIWEMEVIETAFETIPSCDRKLNLLTLFNTKYLDMS